MEPRLARMTSKRSNKPVIDRRLARAALVAGLFLAFGMQSSPRPANAAGNAAQAELKFATERKLARRNLERAHDRVEKARAEVREAKAELDGFVEQHFKRPALKLTQPPAVEIRPLENSVENPAAERIGQRLQEITEQQNQLLELYTPMHPEVVQLELLRTSLSEQLAAITASTKREASLKKPSPKAADKAGEDLAFDDSEEGSVAKYKAIFLRWQNAGRELQVALKAEAAAAEKLASIKLVPVQSPSETTSPAPAEISRPDEPTPHFEPVTPFEDSPPVEATLPTDIAPRGETAPTVRDSPSVQTLRPAGKAPRAEHSPRVKAAPSDENAPSVDTEPVDTEPHVELAPPVDLQPADEDGPSAERPATTASRANDPTEMTQAPRDPQKNSQPLALVAMLAALALAGLAAIKLARASNQGVFTSADEVGAALALPVVGVIPAIVAASPARTAARPVLRGARLFLEIGLALMVFAAVAYFVQDPSFFWRLWDHPLEWLEFAARSRIAE